MHAPEINHWCISNSYLSYMNISHHHYPVHVGKLVWMNKCTNLE